MFRLPRLPPNAGIVDATGLPSAVFMQCWQQVVQKIESSINGIQAALDAAALAHAAAETAQTAATAATTAAGAANTAATAAQATATSVGKEQALINSYIDPSSVLTTTPTMISIAAHTRHYADGPTAAVNAGTVATTATGVTDYVTYVDAARTGGTVTYVASETQLSQGGNVHVVGAITVPATGSATGGTGPRKPGFVEP